MRILRQIVVIPFCVKSSLKLCYQQLETSLNFAHRYIFNLLHLGHTLWVSANVHKFLLFAVHGFHSQHKMYHSFTVIFIIFVPLLKTKWERNAQWDTRTHKLVLICISQLLHIIINWGRNVYWNFTCAFS